MLFTKTAKFFLYLVPFTAVIVYQGSVFPFIVGKYTFFRTIVGLALIFFMLAWAWGYFKFPFGKNNVNQQKKEKQKISPWYKKINPIAIAVFIFCSIYIISGFLGYNPSASFWSNFERGEGGLQILFLAIFFALCYFLFTDEKAWRKMFVVSVWASVLMISYGVFGAMDISDFVGSSLCYRFGGSLGNPAYVGTYLLFSIFFAAYLFNEDKKKFRKWIWAFLLIAFLIFLLLSQTRGAVIGLGAALICGLFFAAFSLPKGKTKIILIILAVVLIASGVLGVKYRKNIDLMPFCKEGGNRILDVSFTTETYNTRLLLWQQAFQAFKERPILGWGPENFSYVFEKTYDTRHYDSNLRANASTRYSQVWFDRAHSIYFDYLIFSGILGLLSFLGIFFVFFWQFFSKTRINAEQKFLEADRRGNIKNKLPITNYQLLITSALLFSLPIAYLVQGLVLFDVLSIYISLFVFLAFAAYKLKN